MSGHGRFAANAAPAGSALLRAAEAWQGIVGAEHVSCAEDALESAATATFATNTQVFAIIRPGTRAEVQECLRVANRLHVPIYAASSGKNWGYGSRAPVRDAVLLDLARLNKIVDFDEELGFITVEPGVTQRQLFAYLRERKSKLWMDATGASPDCSIVGNTLERGFGHTPMGDHCGNACGLEVVLPTGECVSTGFSRFSGARAGPVSRWGLGPSLDGLFSQSNLGIVTRMTVWLMPAPEHFEAFFFKCDAVDGLESIIDALRPLRMNGTLRSVMHIGNDYKVIAAGGQFPFDEQGTGRLEPEAVRRIRSTMNIGSWNGSGGLYGTRAQVKDARRQLRRALKGKVARLQFVDDRLLGIMRRFATPFRLITGWDARGVLAVIAPVYGLLKGEPTDATLASMYWRKTLAPSAAADPDRDRCGLMWCSPIVPNLGSHAADVTSLATKVLLEHGFEPQISVSLATERTLICVITISYDRDVPGEDQRATRCYRSLTTALLTRGYPPYRLNVDSMDFMGGEGEYGNLLRALKTAVDPNGILAPGRYDGTVHSLDHRLKLAGGTT